MIFYFTATGNCLYVARELARATGDEIASIPQEMAHEGELRYQADAIGIVCPIYGHMLPAMVREFIRRAAFEAPYVYIVLTYGNRHANAVELACEDARAVGVEPAYVSTLLMVDNWLPGYDMDEQRARIPEKRIGENLARIVGDVTTRRRWIEPVTDADRAAHQDFLKSGMSFDAGALPGFLRFDSEACTGCGTCVKVCPAGCNAMEDGAAVHDATAGDGCNVCLACIHACPAHAISIPMGEKNPAVRFRNEHVSLADLVAANNRR